MSLTADDDTTPNQNLGESSRKCLVLLLLHFFSLLAALF